MFDASWLKEIAAGHFEAELTPLVMTNGYGERFEGQGRLTWTDQEGVRIDAFTNGADTLGKNFGRIPCPVGHLVPSEYYLRLEGRTPGGENVVVERINPSGYTIHAAASPVVWKISPESVRSNVTIIQPSGCSPEAVRKELLLSPVDLLWPRGSTTTYENPHFGVQSSDLDWLEFACSEGHVAARRFERGLALVRVVHAESGDPHISPAISLAFSFLLGRTVSILASEAHDTESVTRIIPRSARVRTEQTFSPPLSFDGLLQHAFCETLLSQAVEFFRTEIGRRVGNLLHMCHASRDSTFTVNALVACVVLESLVKLLVREKRAERTIADDQKEKILAKVREVGLDERVVERFSGFIGKMDEVGPKNYLHAWAANGYWALARKMWMRGTRYGIERHTGDC